MSEYLCEFCKTVAVAEPKMICDKCFEEEQVAQKRDEEMFNYYNEQQRIRYAGTAVLDNEIGRVTVSHHRKILRMWNYNIFGHLDEHSRYQAKIEARGYLEGWLDAL